MFSAGSGVPVASKESVWLWPAPPVPDMSESCSDGKRVCGACAAATTWSIEMRLV